MESPELSTSLCNGEGNSGPKVEVEKTLFRLIVAGVAPSLVALIGVVGNVISALVLSRPQMKSSLCCLLLGLTLCDTILIIITTFITGLEPLFHHFQIAEYYINYVRPLLIPIFYPLGMTAHTGSVYFTLAVTLERFIVVCYPIEARTFCTWNRACFYSAILFVFSILYNLPRWWEFHSVEINTTDSTSYLEAVMTQLRCNNNYIEIYVLWANFVVLYLIPMLALIVLNIIIYVEIRKTNRMRQVLSKYQSRENSLTIMLLMVVLVFLLCSILPLVNNLIESMSSDSDVSSASIDIANFLVTLNSSVNCIIYCIFGEKFRKQLIKTCPCFRLIFPTKPVPNHSATLTTNAVSALNHQNILLQTT